MRKGRVARLVVEEYGFAFMAKATMNNGLEVKVLGPTRAEAMKNLREQLSAMYGDVDFGDARGNTSR